MNMTEEFIKLVNKNVKENNVRMMFRYLVNCEEIRDQFIEELVNMYFGKMNEENLKHLCDIAREKQ